MSLEDVDLRHLRALREVAIEGSFLGAADVLGYSQAAISQQIASLERALGQAVFDRPGGPRPATLTPAGRILLGHAEVIFSQLELAEEDLNDLASGTSGRLRIGTYESVSVQLLPKLIRALLEEAPDIAVSLVEHDFNDELADLLMQADIDVTFLAGPHHDSRLRMIDVGVDPFVLLVSPGSELAEQYPGKTVPTVALSGVALVGQHPSGTATDPIDSGLRAQGIRARYAFRTNDNGAMQAMVRVGLGPAVMPLLAVDTSDRDVIIKKLDPPLDPRTIIVAVPADATLSPATERFVRIARREARQRLRLT
ncbi:MAG: LysR family transcriptional regulator [Actinomycetales bacterium]|nr:LysR family transcriptional regulator [Actinomycetales bacterium]